jgi:ABC-type transport system substrate-binding protein
MKDAGYFNVKPILGTYFVVINLEGDSDFLKDPRVRKALALAIDRDYIIEVAQNEAVPAFEFVPAGVPDADGTDFIAKNGGPLFGTGDYAADLAEAKALLAEAGYKVAE